MKNLNVGEYLNKVDGDTLPAEEWNDYGDALLEKINELVDHSNQVSEMISGLDGSENGETNQLTKGFLRLMYYPPIPDSSN